MVELSLDPRVAVLPRRAQERAAEHAVRVLQDPFAAPYLVSHFRLLRVARLGCDQVWSDMKIWSSSNRGRTTGADCVQLGLARLQKNINRRPVSFAIFAYPAITRGRSRPPRSAPSDCPCRAVRRALLLPATAAATPVARPARGFGVPR